MNIIFTAAGRGTRFKGYSKPFFRIHGKTLLEWSMGSLGLEGQYWIIGNENWTPDELREVDDVLLKLKIPGRLFFVSGAPGQAAHALDLAQDLNPDEPLLICNCDQYTPWDYKKFEKFLDNCNFDGIVTTYPHDDFCVGLPSKYSHILMRDGIGVKLAEKVAISEDSLNGLFFFRKCSDFVVAARQLVKDMTCGEAYVSLVYNYLIESGKRIGIYKMQENEFVSLGSLDEVMKNISKL